MTKEYELVNDKGLIVVKWKGGGEISPTLSGKYTSYREAQLAIDHHEATKQKCRQAPRKTIRKEVDAPSQDTA